MLNKLLYACSWCPNFPEGASTKICEYHLQGLMNQIKERINIDYPKIHYSDSIDLPSWPNELN